MKPHHDKISFFRPVVAFPFIPPSIVSHNNDLCFRFRIESIVIGSISKWRSPTVRRDTMLDQWSRRRPSTRGGQAGRASHAADRRASVALRSRQREVASVQRADDYLPI